MSCTIRSTHLVLLDVKDLSLTSITVSTVFDVELRTFTLSKQITMMPKLNVKLNQMISSNFHPDYRYSITIHNNGLYSILTFLLNN